MKTMYELERILAKEDNKHPMFTCAKDLMDIKYWMVKFYTNQTADGKYRQVAKGRGLSISAACSDLLTALDDYRKSQARFDNDKTPII